MRLILTQTYHNSEKQGYSSCPRKKLIFLQICDQSRCLLFMVSYPPLAQSLSVSEDHASWRTVNSY